MPGKAHYSGSRGVRVEALYSGSQLAALGARANALGAAALFFSLESRAFFFHGGLCAQTA